MWLKENIREALRSDQFLVVRRGPDQLSQEDLAGLVNSPLQDLSRDYSIYACHFRTTHYHTTTSLAGLIYFPMIWLSSQRFHSSSFWLILTCLFDTDRDCCNFHRLHLILSLNLCLERVDPNSSLTDKRPWSTFVDWSSGWFPEPNRSSSRAFLPWINEYENLYDLSTIRLERYVDQLFHEQFAIKQALNKNRINVEP